MLKQFFRGKKIHYLVSPLDKQESLYLEAQKLVLFAKM